MKELRKVLEDIIEGDNPQIGGHSYPIDEDLNVFDLIEHNMRVEILMLSYHHYNACMNRLVDVVEALDVGDCFTGMQMVWSAQREYRTFLTLCLPLLHHKLTPNELKLQVDDMGSNYKARLAAVKMLFSQWIYMSGEKVVY